MDAMRKMVVVDDDREDVPTRHERLLDDED